MFVIVREVAFGEDYVLEFCGETYSEMLQENRGWQCRQIRIIYRWYLGLIVKSLCCITCLNAWATNCASF